MDGDPESLEDGIQLEFDLARLELADARRAFLADDSPASRQRVDECRARLDRILDMWNDVLVTTAWSVHSPAG
ncbi:hypothetical protein [Petropleomorpha daqingensis]|uniref:Uncharacterized protein n=1 Tax=Petropleomorpha daqingensis TaxID=2026353 RepID=A0A853CSA9_9ACTN|nr:hypothetical protein [Petropleomorpha daqingensis]NYJ08773.1 hypothetical protein [Petropleomorpha daqingensis]